MTVGWALFDFDGTITTRDTTRYLLLQLLRLRPWKVYQLTSLLLASASRSEERLQKQKNRCIGALLIGLDELQVKAAVLRYQRQVNVMFRNSVLAAIEECLKSGDRVLVVTASPEFALAGMFQDSRIECIGTRFNRVNGVYDGTLAGPPCYGASKVPAIELVIGNDDNAEIVAAWSDSISDLPMMSLSDRRYWICSAANARKIAAADPMGKIVESNLD